MQLVAHHHGNKLLAAQQQQQHRPHAACVMKFRKQQQQQQRRRAIVVAGASGSGTAAAAAAAAAAPATTTTTIKIGARGSKLAQLQASEVKNLLSKVNPDWAHLLELVAIETAGDAAGAGAASAPSLRELGQGAFTDAIDRAVAAGAVDVGVHSLKDAPAACPPGVRLAACLPRSDPRDALLTASPRQHQTLADLPRGARVGTSSLRRKAQLLAQRPDLAVVPLRGNLDARLAALTSGELDAIVLAAAGLARLGQASLVTRVLSFEEMLPAACQGAIGVTCAEGDVALRHELAMVCHEPTRLEVAAERALLRALLLREEEDEQKEKPATDEGNVGEEGQQQQQQPHASAPAAAPHAHGAPTPAGISAVTGLPLLPQFAIAAHAAFNAHDGALRVEGMVASEDGRTVHRASLSGVIGAPDEAEAVGAELGRQLRAFAEQHGWV